MTSRLSGLFSMIIWFGLLCAQVSSGNRNTTEWLEIAVLTLNPYQDSSTSYGWPVKNAIVDLPIKMKGNSKCSSSNLLSLLGARTRILALLPRV